jgi:hypothetical protein
VERVFRWRGCQTLLLIPNAFAVGMMQACIESKAVVTTTKRMVLWLLLVCVFFSFPEKNGIEIQRFFKRISTRKLCSLIGPTASRYEDSQAGETMTAEDSAIGVVALKS